VTKIIKALLKEHGKAENEWDSVLQQAQTQLNRCPVFTGDGTHSSAHERQFGGRPFVPSLSYLSSLAKPSQTEDSASTHDKCFKVGDRVLFHPSRMHFRKFEVGWFKYVVVSEVSCGRIYKIRRAPNFEPKLPTDGPQPPEEALASVNDLRLDVASQPSVEAPPAPVAQQTASVPAEIPPPKMPSPFPVPSEPLRVGDMIVFKDLSQWRLFVARVESEPDALSGLFEVRMFGSYSSGLLGRRVFKPSWQLNDGRVTFSPHKQASAEPETALVHTGQVVAHGFALDKQKRLPAEVVEATRQGVDKCSFLGVNSADSFLRDYVAFSAALAAETTHKDFKWSDLSDAERAEAEAARAAELQKFIEFDVYESVPRHSLPHGAKLIPVSWVDSLKNVEKDGVLSRAFKSRLVMCGNRDPRDRDLLDTRSATCKHDILRLCLIAAMSSSRWSARQARQLDIRSAYLQAPLGSETDVYALPPDGSPDRLAGKVWRLRKAVYGLADAGKAFEKFRNKQLSSLGYYQSSSATPSVWLKRGEGGELLYIVCMYVDDFAIFGVCGDASECVRELRTVFDCGEDHILSTYVGVDFHVRDECVYVSQSRYVSSLCVPDGQPPRQPLPASAVTETDKSPLLDAAGVTSFRSLLGALMYVASNTRPDLAYACSFLGQWSAAPTQRALRLLYGVARYAKSTHMYALRLPKPSPNVSVDFCMHADASFGDIHNVCNNSVRSQCGHVFMFYGVPIAWRSFKLGKASRSTVASEMYALDDAVDYVLSVLPLLRCLFGSAVHVSLHSDAADLLALLAQEHPTPKQRALTHDLALLKEKHAVIYAYALCDDLRAHKLFPVHKIASELNVADLMTKPLPMDAMHARMCRLPR
jgi:hypothetical protein